MDYEVKTPTDLRLSNIKTAGEDCFGSLDGRRAALRSELGWSTRACGPQAAWVHGTLISFGFSPGLAGPMQSMHISVIRITLCCFYLKLPGTGRLYSHATWSRSHLEVRALEELEIEIKEDT